MTIEIHTPQLEKRMQEAIRNGNFSDLDELLIQALDALREKNAAAQGSAPPSVAEALFSRPFLHSELPIPPRHRDYPHSAEL
jgi:hypothetical protein